MTGHTFSYDYGEHVPDAPIHKITIEVDHDATIDQMADALRAYLLACGYHHEAVAGILPEDE